MCYVFIFIFLRVWFLMHSFYFVLFCCFFLLPSDSAWKLVCILNNVRCSSKAWKGTKKKNSTQWVFKDEETKWPNFFNTLFWNVLCQNIILQTVLRVLQRVQKWVFPNPYLPWRVVQSIMASREVIYSIYNRSRTSPESYFSRVFGPYQLHRLLLLDQGIVHCCQWRY